MSRFGRKSAAQEILGFTVQAIVVFVVQVLVESVVQVLEELQFESLPLVNLARR
jgi:hypothetical protein